MLVFPAQVRYNKKWIWTGLFFGKGEGKFDEKMENDGIDLKMPASGSLRLPLARYLPWLLPDEATYQTVP